MPWNSTEKNKFVVTIDGQKTRLSDYQIEKIIKDKLMNSQIVQNLLNEFELSKNRLNNLSIKILPLDKKYAETDGESIRLNTILFDTENFFEDYFFVVIHELVHWFSRIKEEESYFHDPEEVLGFCASVAYEMEKGTDMDIIWNKIYNKVSWHFNDERDARNFFSNLIDKAKKLLGKGKFK